jgi:hypothetical protein
MGSKTSKADPPIKARSAPKRRGGENVNPALIAVKQPALIRLIASAAANPLDPVFPDVLDAKWCFLVSCREEGASSPL